MEYLIIILLHFFKFHLKNITLLSKAERSAILYKLPEVVCPRVRNFNSVTKIKKIKMAAGCRSNATSTLNTYISKRRFLDFLTQSDHQIQTKGVSSLKA